MDVWRYEGFEQMHRHSGFNLSLRDARRFEWVAHCHMTGFGSSMVSRNYNTLMFRSSSLLVLANHAASTQGLLHHLSSSSSWPSDVRKNPSCSCQVGMLTLNRDGFLQFSMLGPRDEDAREIST